MQLPTVLVSDQQILTDFGADRGHLHVCSHMSRLGVKARIHGDGTSFGYDTGS